MLDITFIRNSPEEVGQGVARKGTDPKIVERVLRVDESWRSKVKTLDDLKAEQNELSRALAKGKKEDLLSKAELLKERTQKIKKEADDLKERRDELISQLPNIPFEDVPTGEDESANKVVKEVGKKPEFDFKPKDHLTLGESLGIIDVKRAAKVAGTRFGYLVRDGVLLEFALVRLAFDVLIPHGFIPMVPPVMIRPDLLAGMGRLSPGDKDERYYFPDDDLYLVGTAEHTVGPFHAGETLPGKDLPLRYVGFSTCFRREAGSYGRDTRGIMRVHQFDKVEMFSFAHPEKSEEEYQFLLGLQEELMDKLKLPYRVKEMCTGDMGWTDARQHDIEAWFPSEGEYKETHSCSNTTDFQARGVGVKYGPAGGGKPAYLHTLNATAFSQRPILAIIENYQTKDGKVTVPRALQKYVGKKEIS